MAEPPARWLYELQDRIANAEPTDTTRYIADLGMRFGGARAASDAYYDRGARRADKAIGVVNHLAQGVGDLVTAPTRVPQKMRALDPMNVPEEFADMTWQERLVAQSALERERADWGAGMGTGMVGMARLPAGSVGSGAARLGSGPNGQWVPILDNAEVYKMLAQQKRDQGIGTGTQRVFETRQQLEKTQRPQTDWELAVAKARAGLQRDAKMAADDFATEVRPYAGPTHLEHVWPDDPISPGAWRPEAPPNVPPGPGMTSKESMSLADLLRTFGSGAGGDRGVPVLLPSVAAEKQGGIRAYHASPNDFTRFDIGKAGTTTDSGQLGQALYFSTDPSVAARGPYRYETNLDIKSPLNVEMLSFRDAGRKTDIVRDALGLPANATAADIRAAALAKGHDSVVLDYAPTGYQQKEIAVFDDSLVNIMRKYGLAGLPAAGVAAGVAGTMQDARQ